jgi:hypothetical protein
VLVAAYQGTHDWGDLYALLFFGVVGWIMKQRNWPRPPLVLGFVVGETFERYLFISTQLYGWQWVLRPVVIVIMAGVAWALYAPMRRIFASVWRELRQVRGTKLRSGFGALFTPAILLAILGAMALAHQWPRPAQLVPMTACAIALVMCVLNWVNELFGAPDRPSAHPDSTAPAPVPEAVVNRRALQFFLWLGGFVGLVAGIGFLPAIVVFVIANMTLAYGMRLRVGVLSGAGVGVFCWVVFQMLLQVVWPESLLGDWLPGLRTGTGFL